MIHLTRSIDLEDEFLKSILRRGRVEVEAVEKDVRSIVEAVRTRGDDALFEYTERLDGAIINSNTVKATKEDIDAAYNLAKEAEIKALERAASNIERFHKMQLERLDFRESGRGITLGVVARPIPAVGVYAPGGKASYPSSVLMCAVPAKAAGVERLVVCSPPSPRNRFNPYILLASDIAGVDEIYCVGGAQAIAAMAYGTKTLRPVDKIVGPGNIYVNAAKQLLSRYVSIDLPAGPSEILIVADESAKPEFIAADLLAQAEHDEDAVCILLTNSEDVAYDVQERLSEMTSGRPPKLETIRGALEKNGLIVTVKDLKEATTLANQIAPEHLVIMTRKPRSVLKAVRNAGLVFLGSYSPVAIGDYSAGTNHVLPTGGYALTYSGLSVRDFLKTISYIDCSRKGLKNLAQTTITLAEIEGMWAHSKSIQVRDVQE